MRNVQDIFVRIVFAVLVASLASCAFDPKSDRTLKSTDILPNYVPGQPLGKTMAVYVGGNAFGAPSIFGRQKRDLTGYLRPFIPALLDGLRAKGYDPVYVGPADLDSICRLNETGLACNVAGNEAVLGYLRDRNISTALTVIVDFFHSGQYASSEGTLNALRATPIVQILDRSGALIRFGRVVEATSYELRELPQEPSKPKRYALKGSDEWGAEIARTCVDMSITQFSPPLFGSVERVQTFLLRGNWRAQWSYDTKFSGSSHGSTGTHTVRFTRRAGDTYAQIGADSGLNAPAIEVPAIVTPVGVTYYVPNLGRVRLKTDNKAEELIGGVITSVFLNSVAAEDDHWYIARVRLKALGAD